LLLKQRTHSRHRIGHLIADILKSYRSSRVLVLNFGPKFTGVFTKEINNIVMLRPELVSP
jgi:hypothetical protein